MRAILVDDEIAILENLQLKLQEYCPDVEIVGTANNLKDGIKIINDQKPDIVFLDVEIPPGTGFDLLKMVDYKDMKVIFVTAHDHYAFKAIKNNAFDYLLKPVIISELTEVIEKLKTNFKESTTTPPQKKQQLDKIEIPYANGITYIEVNEIIRIKGDGPYSEIFLANEENLCVSKTLKYFEEKLYTHHIIRVHKSHMVNITMVKKFERAEGGIVTLVNGDKIEISNRYKDQFLQEMKNNCIP